MLRVTEPGGQGPPPETGGASREGVVRQWHVNVSIFEAGDDTTATVALLADPPEELRSRGVAHRSAADHEDHRIGDEVAVARALRHLADDLLDRAAKDIEEVTGEPDVVVRSR
nr:DUF1876 domain-containing protein [Pedococcus sp. 5OH_020]